MTSHLWTVSDPGMLLVISKPLDGRLNSNLLSKRNDTSSDVTMICVVVHPDPINSGPNPNRPQNTLPSSKNITVQTTISQSHVV